LARRWSDNWGPLQNAAEGIKETQRLAVKCQAELEAKIEFEATAKQFNSQYFSVFSPKTCELGSSW